MLLKYAVHSSVLLFFIFHLSDFKTNLEHCIFLFTYFFAKFHSFFYLEIENRVLAFTKISKRRLVVREFPGASLLLNF